MKSNQLSRHINKVQKAELLDNFRKYILEQSLIIKNSNNKTIFIPTISNKTGINMVIIISIQLRNHYQTVTKKYMHAWATIVASLSKHWFNMEYFQIGQHWTQARVVRQVLPWQHDRLKFFIFLIFFVQNGKLKIVSSIQQWIFEIYRPTVI